MISIKSKVILAPPNRRNYSGIPTGGIQSNDIYSNNCGLGSHRLHVHLESQDLSIRNFSAH